MSYTANGNARSAKHRQFHWVTAAVTLRTTVRWEQTPDGVSVFHSTCALTKYSSFVRLAISNGLIRHPNRISSWLNFQANNFPRDRSNFNKYYPKAKYMSDGICQCLHWVRREASKCLLDLRRMESMQKGTKLVWVLVKEKLFSFIVSKAVVEQ